MISQASHNFLSKKGASLDIMKLRNLRNVKDKKKHKEHNLSYLADYGYPNDLT